MALPFTSLFLDLNSFFASVEQQRNPALRGKAMIVVPVDTDATCAIAASYEAKSFGIKTGTPVWEAKKRCPGLITILGDHQYYTEYHHRIAAAVDTCIPVAEVASIDEFACDLQGPQCTAEGATKLAHDIKRAIRRDVGEAILCSIGVSTNRFLAKVATDMQKPDGLTLLHPDDMPGRLATAPLNDLPGIGHQMLRRLRLKGIGDIPTLWATPPKRMRAIWGSVEGERFWYKLHGVELPRYESERTTVGHSHVLAPEFRPPAAAFIVAQRLLLKAASRLRRMDMATSHLVLSVRLEHGPHASVEARFSHASDTPALMQQLILLWQAMMEHLGPRVRIRKVSVSFFNLVAESRVQENLFTWQEPDTSRRSLARRQALSKAMDRINQRFGRDSLVQGFVPNHVKTFSGTKIAFTRIPDIKEFSE